MHRWLTVRGDDWLAERPAGADEDIHLPTAVAAFAIDEFSTAGDLVLDPFAGFGTVPAEAQARGRIALGIEYNQERAELADDRLNHPNAVLAGDARDLDGSVTALREHTGIDCRERVALCLTSPPYMARNDPENNPLTSYRSGGATYDRYLAELGLVFTDVAQLLRPGGWLAIHAATIIHEDQVTPLAADLTRVIAENLEFRGEIPVAWHGAPDWMVADYLLTFRRAEPTW